MIVIKPMNLSALLKDLLIVIVLHKTRADRSSSYLSLLESVKDSAVRPDIVFYDNSAMPAPIEGEGLIYIHDQNNGGISKAYNTAATCAPALHKRWLLFLDQDTDLPTDFFLKIALTLERSPDSKVFVPRVYDRKGLLSPFRFSSGRGKRSESVPEILPLADYRFINSGLLVEYPVFKAIGGYDEDIPLDFSDISFGGRLQKMIDHFTLIDADLRHDFSGSANLAVEDALTRFRFYCAGAFVLGRKEGRRYAFYLHAFARATRLTYRYLDHRFLRNFLQQAING